VFSHVLALVRPKFISVPEVALFAWIPAESLVIESGIEPPAAMTFAKPLQIATLS